MRKPTKLQLFAAVLVVACLVPAVARAQTDDPTNPNPAWLVACCGFFYLVLGGIVSALQETNTALPWTIPQSARAVILAVGAVALACLLAIKNGTPWPLAIGAAATTMLSTYAKHGADKIAPSATKPA